MKKIYTIKKSRITERSPPLFANRERKIEAITSNLAFPWWKPYLSDFWTHFQIKQSLIWCIKTTFSNFFLSSFSGFMNSNNFTVTIDIQVSRPFTVWKVSKYGVFSGLYFPTFGLDTERYSISPYSVWMRENTEQKKLRIWTLFTQCFASCYWIQWIFMLKSRLIYQNIFWWYIQFAL